MALIELALKVKFHSYWHCGSGTGASGETDLTPVRDAFGLPFVPGRTLKGLLRLAASQLCEFKAIAEKDVLSLFGGGSTSSINHRYRKSEQGVLSVSSATMDEAVMQWFESNEGRTSEISRQFYRRLQMTAVEDSTGAALTKSLRVIDVAVPMELTAQIQLPDDEDLKNALRAAVQLVQAVGAFKHRGLGQATLSLPL